MYTHTGNTILQSSSEGTDPARKAGCQDQPLLPYQRYFLDYQLYSPRSVIMNVPLLCRIPAGAVDVRALKEAVDRVFHYYAVFGTVFTFNDEGSLVQRCRPELIPDVEIQYCSEEEFQTREKRAFVQPFHLVDSLLWRHKIMVTEKNVWLLTDFHHTISDKGMCMVIYRQIFNVLQGQEPIPDQYYLYLEQYAEKMKTPQAASDLQQLALLYKDTWSRFPKPDYESRQNGQGVCWLQTTHSLRWYKDAAKACGASLGMILNAAGLLALSRYNHESKVEIEWIYHGRPEAWQKDLAGLMIEGIPAAMDFDELTTRAQILQEARRQFNLGHRCCEYSYGLRSMSPTRFESMKICYLPGSDDPGNLPEGSDITVWMEPMEGMLCLALIVIAENGPSLPLALRCAYQSTRYSAGSIEKLLRLFSEALDELLPEA